MINAISAHIKPNSYNSTFESQDDRNKFVFKCYALL